MKFRLLALVAIVVGVGSMVGCAGPQLKRCELEEVQDDSLLQCEELVQKLPDGVNAYMKCVKAKALHRCLNAQ